LKKRNTKKTSNKRKPRNGVSLVEMCAKLINRWAKLKQNDPKAAALEERLSAHARPGVYAAFAIGETERYRVYGICINRHVRRGPDAVLVAYEPVGAAGHVSSLMPLLEFRRAVQCGERQMPAFSWIGNLPELKPE